MPRLRAVVLDRTPNGHLNYILWADVPLARRGFYASTGVSAWRGALASDQAAIQSGAVAEAVRQVNVFSTTQAPEIRAQVEADWTAFQAAVDGANPWRFYGIAWDGITWSTSGVT